MSKTLISLAAFLFPSLLSAQGNFPFPNTPVEWVLEFITPVLGPDDDRWLSKNWLDGDTLVNDTLYFKIYYQRLCYNWAYPENDPTYYPYAAPNAWLIGGIRQDTEKVYYRSFKPNEQGNDIVLYDYTLEPGDSIVDPFENTLMVVNEVKFTSEGRKQIVLKASLPWPFWTTWTQGRASSRGLFASGFYYIVSYCENLDNQNPCSLPCTPGDPQFPTATHALPTILSASITPSPAHDRVSIHLDKSDLLFMLEIYSLQGRLLEQFPNYSSDQEIFIDNLPAGFLLCKVVTATGQYGWYKLLRQ